MYWHFNEHFWAIPWLESIIGNGKRTEFLLCVHFVGIVENERELLVLFSSSRKYIDQASTSLNCLREPDIRWSWIVIQCRSPPQRKSLTPRASTLNRRSIRIFLPFEAWGGNRTLAYYSDQISVNETMPEHYKISSRNGYFPCPFGPHPCPRQSSPCSSNIKALLQYFPTQAHGGSSSAPPRRASFLTPCSAKVRPCHIASAASYIISSAPCDILMRETTAVGARRAMRCAWALFSVHRVTQLSESCAAVKNAPGY